MQAPTPFSRLQQRVNRAVQQRLSNAVCSVDGGPGFSVIFDRAPQETLGVYGGNVPTVSFALASAPAVAQGSALEIEGEGAFEVVDPVEPDASGWVVLSLREVANG